MITLLLLEASHKSKFDVEEFLEKTETTLDELGQCPLVLHMLSKLMDASMKSSNKEYDNGYIFSPIIDDDTEEFNNVLEDKYNSIFTPEDKLVFESIGPSVSFHAKTPEDFREIMGKNSYFLTRNVKGAFVPQRDAFGSQIEDEETPLYGIFEDEDPINMTSDERRAVEGQGIPMGGLIFLYLVSLLRSFNNLMLY